MRTVGPIDALLPAGALGFMSCAQTVYFVPVVGSVHEYLYPGPENPPPAGAFGFHVFGVISGIRSCRSAALIFPPLMRLASGGGSPNPLGLMSGQARPKGSISLLGLPSNANRFLPPATPSGSGLSHLPTSGSKYRNLV